MAETERVTATEEKMIEGGFQPSFAKLCSVATRQLMVLGGGNDKVDLAYAAEIGEAFRLLRQCHDFLGDVGQSDNGNYPMFSRLCALLERIQSQSKGGGE